MMDKKVLSIERVATFLNHDYRIRVLFTWQTGFWLWKSTHTAVESFRGASTVWHRESDGVRAVSSMERWLSAAMKRYKWAQEA